MKSNTEEIDRRQLEQIIQSLSRDRETRERSREPPEIILRSEEPGILSIRGP